MQQPQASSILAAQIESPSFSPVTWDEMSGFGLQSAHSIHRPIPPPLRSFSMIVMITGASAGFGAEMARKFVKQGHQVIAAARRTDRLDALAAELGTALLPVELDVTSKASIDHALASLPPAWQALDVLVNNAGLALGLEPAYQAHLEDWETMIATN
eukprot:gene51470-68878_t